MNFTYERRMRWMIASWMLGIVSINQARAESDVHPMIGATEEVLVVGEHPGPGLWKVSKGSHTLWLLGTYVPTPKGMIWRSKQVESVIEVSNEVLGPYSVSLRVQEAQPYLARKGTLKEVINAGTYSNGNVFVAPASMSTNRGAHEQQSSFPQTSSSRVR